MQTRFMFGHLRSGRSLPSLAVCLACAVAGPSCGGDSGGGGIPIDPEPAPAPTAELRVALASSDAQRSLISSVHVWALSQKSGAAATCAKLVGGELTPYDLIFRRTADLVGSPAVAEHTAPAVELGPTFVYVEAVNHLGLAEFAGCVTTTVAQPSTAVTVSLALAGVFDCADPATQNGAPCDDGKRCTVGDSCKAGKCVSGPMRECTHKANACNAGTCSEELGCLSTPLPNNTPCDDGYVCTQPDVCNNGECVGSPRDCAAEAPECQTSSGCSELFGGCQFADDYEQNGQSCGTGSFCIENGVCSWGECQGTQRDCSSLDQGPCRVGVCDEESRSCVREVKAAGTVCYLSCTQNYSSSTFYADTCDEAGICQPGYLSTLITCSGTAGHADCINTTCTETYENVTYPCYKPNNTPCDSGTGAGTGYCSSGYCYPNYY